MQSVASRKNNYLNVNVTDLKQICSKYLENNLI